MIEPELTIVLTQKLAEQFQVQGLEYELHALARRALALECFRQGHLSMGQAAELAGLDRAQFVTALARRRIPAIDLPDEELDRELANVDAMMKGRDKS